MYCIREGAYCIRRGAKTYILHTLSGKKNIAFYRLNNIINKLEKWLEEHSQVDFECNDNIVHEQLALSMAYEYLKELKEGK